jgi:hypothetical protein
VNLEATISVLSYGTSDGVKKAWDTRGRGRIDPDRVFRKLPAGHREYLQKGWAKLRRVPISSLRGLPSYYGYHSPQPLRDVKVHTVEHRANQMTAGKGFAPAVLWPSGDRHHVQDGMHRIAAFRKAFPEATHVRALVLTDKGKARDKLYEQIGRYQIGR